MLHDLEAYRAPLERDFGIHDLTMIIAVRAHEANPWVLERLEWHATWYVPRPHILIVDFGSEGEYRDRIAAICKEHDLDLFQVADYETYSPARARNLGFAATRTPLVYFNDVDCFGPADHFVQLLRAANALGFGAYPDQMLNLPVVHLSEQATEDLLRFEASARGRALHRLALDALVDDHGRTADFVAPYSNIFLCRREMFELTGGYDESFRGHGSEDFEFLLRWVQYAGGLPLPDEPGKDCFGPMKKDFFGPKPYRGFRRLFEALSYSAEVEGLRTVHLHHDKPTKDGKGWYDRNDWRRSRFNDAVDAYLEKPSGLLQRDWLPRSKRCLVLMKHEDHAAFFPPLRWAGYELETLPLDEPAELTRTVDRIEAGEFDAVALFNPYMQSHAELRPYFELAKRAGAEPIVIERGALPESWYYAPAVSYADTEFTELNVDALSFDDDELEAARVYRSELAEGRAALEHQQDPEVTRARLHVYTKWAPRRVLVPLQLDEDMAVTRFTDGHISYPDYKAELERMAEHEDVLFFLKPHPLDKGALRIDAPNVIRCTEGENIHALIDAVDAVVCYNSGVGVLAMLQGKRVVTFGNAYYNRPGFGREVSTLADAIEAAFDDSVGASDEQLDALTAWLLFRKYSFFKARDVIREFETRKSHGYRDQRFYRLSIPGGVDVRWCRASAARPMGTRGYAAARLGLNVGRDVKLDSPAPPTRPFRTRTARKVRKLVRDPHAFFADSQHRVLRSLGTRLFPA